MTFSSGFKENHLTHLAPNPPKFDQVSLLLDIDGNLIGHSSQVLVIIMWSMPRMSEGSQIATIVKNGEVDICSLWLSLTKINDLCPCAH